MKKILTVLIPLLAAAVAAGCAPAPAPVPAPKPPASVSTPEPGVTAGKAAPRFTLGSLDGAQVAAPVPGKVTVLNFWATWCPPCRAEMPELDKFAAANPAVAFYAVNLEEPASKVAAFLGERGLSLPGLLDAGGDAARAYRIRSIPTTVVVDRDGIIRYRKSGPVTAAELAGVVQGL
ncbi:TlpA family protein disulfide reductase [Anaeroselena agilis]|uniref:TlpA disulfide reductase family protein n=1 Tax=Anaeroselena agilis TaxID=3063788 RepID=A0ABU3NYZ8_9FIRM|nr:TlpA disulfide reductase family protein [Selenomonadales bacterium 4137-cl]